MSAGAYLSDFGEAVADLVDDKLLNARLHELELLLVSDGVGGDRLLERTSPHARPCAVLSCRRDSGNVEAQDGPTF